MSQWRSAREDFGKTAEVIIVCRRVLAHEDEDRWGHLELSDFVILYDLEHVFVDECRHYVNGDIELSRHEHGVELAVGVIQWEEADPALGSRWVFASSFELWFLGVLEEDGLFGIGDQVILGLATLVSESDEARVGGHTIMTPLGRPVVPLE